MKNATMTTKKSTAQRRLRKIRDCIVFLYIYAAVILFTIGLIIRAISIGVDSFKASAKAENIEPKETVSQSEKMQETTENEPMEVQEAPSVFFDLTAKQRTLIEQVVSAEARGEPYDGQIAVAQCILNACKKDNITPEQVIKKYKYTGNRAEPTDSVKKAVAAVFDQGLVVTNEPIIYFYCPKMTKSKWHESQTFVIEIGNHRFFKEA